MNYVVETATNLNSPFWTPVQTNVTAGSGMAEFTNDMAMPEQYFRYVFP